MIDSNKRGASKFLKIKILKALIILRKKHFDDSDEEESDEEEHVETESEIKVKILIGTDYKKVPENHSRLGTFWHPVRLIKDFDYDDVRNKSFLKGQENL